MSIITPQQFANLREIRAFDPAAVSAAMATRARRPLRGDDGRLFIVAADHPARGALAVGSDRMAMADRYDLLQRLVTALERPGVDGVLGTPDIIADLAVLGALQGKIVVGSMNRGGIAGATFEMDDRYTAYDVPTMREQGIDVGKALVRIDPREPATVRTLAETARIVTEAAAAELPIMLEPFWRSRQRGTTVNDLTPDGVITSIAVASALGADSAYTWMKLPVVAEMERVMASTTLPTLLLGGDDGGHPDERLASWERALALPGVRGLTVGRTLLFPQDSDVAGAVDAAARLVHPSVDAVQRLVDPVPTQGAGVAGAYAVKESE